jgi:hypothetical protein
MKLSLTLDLSPAGRGRTQATRRIAFENLPGISIPPETEEPGYLSFSVRA